MYSRTPRLLGCLLLALCLAPTAEAQQFGKNKVRYREFDFRVLETPHFDIYYYPVEQEAARQAGVLAERWYDELSRRLDHQLARRQPLVLYATSTDFSQTNVVSGRLSEGTGGVTEGRRNRIALPFGLGLAETSHVIGHELVHAFQYDLARRGHPSIVMMPLWFIEGMAEYLTLGPGDAQTAMWMRDVARQDKQPSLKDLSNPKYFPYRERARRVDVSRPGLRRRGPDAPPESQAVRPGRQAEGGDGAEPRRAHGGVARGPPRRVRRPPRPACRGRPRAPGPPEDRGPDPHRPLDQPGREERDLHLREGPVLDRDLPGRRPHGNHPDEAPRPRHQPALRQHPVPRQLRRLGSFQPPHRLRGVQAGPGRPHDPRRAGGTHRTGDSARGAGDCRDSRVVARRPAAGVCRTERGLDGPLHLRPRVGRPAAEDP